jgi:diguanylate cyclase (GGDEF)-like protein/PAS domain S-box-containing protein
MKCVVSLRSTIAFLLLILVALSQLISYWAANDLLELTVREREIDKVRTISKVVEKLIHYHAERIKQVAGLLAFQSESLANLDTQDHKVFSIISRNLDKAFTIANIDLLELTDDQEAVVYRAQLPASRGVHAAAWGVFESLRGRSQLVSTFDPESITIRAIEPLWMSGKVIGTLAAGVSLNQRFLMVLSKEVGAEVALLTRSGLLLDAGTVIAASLDQKAISAAFQQKIPIYTENAATHHTFVYLPLLIIDNSCVIIIRLDSISAYIMLENVLHTAAVRVAITFIVVFLIAIIALRYLMAPLHHLRTRAEKICLETFGEVKVFKKHDEVGSVVEALEYLTNYLISRNERFTLITETVSEVFVITEVKEQYVLYVSAAYEKIWQRSCSSLYENPRSFIEGIHQDDRDLILLEAGEALSASKRYDREFRVVRADDSIRWVRMCGFPIKEVNGKVSRYVGVITDITEKIVAETNLRMLNEELEMQVEKRTGEFRLAATAVQNTSEGVMVTDLNAIIVSVNPAFSRLTGYSAEESAGKNANLLRSDHHDKDFYLQMWTSLQRQGRWGGEIWNRRKDGSVFLERQMINVVKDKHGHPTHYVSVFNDITEARSKDEHIRHMAYHDALTGLPNSLLLTDCLEREIMLAHRREARLGVLFFDLDRFKAVNDNFGHNVGDLLLREVAQRILDRIRNGDTLARLGGDEFVIVMGEVASPGDCAVLAKIIIERLNEPMIILGHTISIGASVGIAVYPDDGGDSTALMKCADTAMYAAKGAGRGVYRFFQTEMFERASKRLEIESGLRNAIANSELCLYYQPKINVRNGMTQGYEALLRWNNPQLGAVSPVDFIPIAEDSGIIFDIGYWVIDEACRQIAAWQSAGHGLKNVAINVSALQLRDNLLVTQIKETAIRHGIPTNTLEIEVTESAIMTNPEKTTKILLMLRDIGVKIAIDDFGTGYSSLAYLRRLPIDVLKIDRSFVMDADKNEDDAEIVRTIISLAKVLRLDVVAEGVETEAQAKLLDEAGCDLFQGYLFSYPLPAHDSVPPDLNFSRFPASTSGNLRGPAQSGSFSTLWLSPPSMRPRDDTSGPAGYPLIFRRKLSK